MTEERNMSLQNRVIEPLPYNKALFDSMAMFADAVWELNAEDQLIYILHDDLSKSRENLCFTFDEARVFLKKDVAPKVWLQISMMLDPQYIKSLKQSVKFSTSVRKSGKFHTLKCVLTPSPGPDGEVHRAYITLQDIQAQVDQEEQVRQTKEELNRYLSAISCGIIQYTRDSKEVIFANDIALSILGYESIEELQDEDFDGVAKSVLDEDAENLKRMISDLTEDGDSFECEYRVRHKSGNIHTCYGTVRLITQEQKEPIIQRSIVDITDSRKTVHLYHEVTEVLKGAEMGLWYIFMGDGEPRFMVDAETANLVGCDPDLSSEECFSFWLSNIDAAYRRDIHETMEKMKRGEAAEIVYNYHHPQRGEIIVRVGGLMNQNYEGKGVMFRGYYQDITEYSKRLEEQKEKEKLERENLRALAAIYTTLHFIDLKKGVFEEKAAAASLHDYLQAHSQEELQSLMWGVMKSRYKGVFLDKIIPFTDFSTLEERMGKNKSISIELIGINNLWFRHSFIRVGEINEPLTKVLFVTQNIDDEKRHEENLILMSETDELTQLYNRHAYERDTDQLERDGLKRNLWLITMDLNGLKQANDNIGHDAGDELLKAMADCLRFSLGQKGKSYRTGGDEFAAIFHGNRVSAESILARMEIFQQQWKGNLNDSFSFSKGIVNVKELKHCTISTLEKECDKRMYVEKRAYYVSRADRRRR